MHWYDVPNERSFQPNYTLDMYTSGLQELCSLQWRFTRIKLVYKKYACGIGYMWCTRDIVVTVVIWVFVAKKPTDSRGQDKSTRGLNNAGQNISMV